jgi:tetratricopeptide (TPR) repeat protein/predicted Ser/Thr protein kinase
VADSTEIGDGEPTELDRPQPRTKPAMLERGTTVGRYVILDPLGKGGMGVVYRAFDPKLDRRVAIKLLHAGSASDAWLVREAHALARLSHPNVVAVYDVGTAGNRVFIAMELVDGDTLRAWLRERRTWREAVPVLIAAGYGLAAAHASGLVHRDFKPENVIVGRDGRTRVMDFGLARLEGEPATDDDAPSSPHVAAHLTMPGTVIGTPAYMAPELESQPADARSDQFSYGVTLYEALHQERPGKSPRQRVRVPARLRRIAMRAIARDPAARFRSMDELLAALADEIGPRRRPVLFAVGALAASAAGIASYVALTHSPPEQCTGADAQLAGAWDIGVKLRVRAAFEATGSPQAKTASAAVERAVEQYATDWVAASTESCVATRVRGEQTAEVQSLRQACLDQRLRELRALTGRLATADRDLVDRGSSVVSGLEPVGYCANIAALLAPAKPPDEPRDKVREFQTALADMRADNAIGHYTQALATSNRALVIADELRELAWKAETLLHRGAAFAALNRLDESNAAFREAVWTGLEGHSEYIAAEAAGSTAFFASSHNAAGEAQIWLDLAKVMVARSGHDPALEVIVLRAESSVAAARGDMAAALAAQQKVLASREQAFGRDSLELWLDHQAIALSFMTAGSYDKAIPHLERALALRESAVGKEHVNISELLDNLGVCYSRTGQPDKAHAAYDRALAIREKVEGTGPMFMLTLNNMADGLMRTGNPAAALIHAERAKQLAIAQLNKKAPMYHAVATTHAEALAANRRVDEARAEYDEIIALESPRSVFLGATLDSRGQMELEAKQWAAAAAFERRAIDAIEAANGKNATELWKPLAGLGRAYLELARAADARPLLDRAIAIAEKADIGERELAPLRALRKRAAP